MPPKKPPKLYEKKQSETSQQIFQTCPQQIPPNPESRIEKTKYQTLDQKSVKIRLRSHLQTAFLEFRKTLENTVRVFKNQGLERKKQTTKSNEFIKNL